VTLIVERHFPNTVKFRLLRHLHFQLNVALRLTEICFLMAPYFTDSHERSNRFESDIILHDGCSFRNDYTYENIQIIVHFRLAGLHRARISWSRKSVFTSQKVDLRARSISVHSAVMTGRRARCNVISNSVAAGATRPDCKKHTDNQR